MKRDDDRKAVLPGDIAPTKVSEGGPVAPPPVERRAGAQIFEGGRAGAQPEPTPVKGALPTLYRARLSDPRERAAQPAEALRGRAARRAEETSDVTRFRGILAATLAAAAATVAVAILSSPTSGLSSPGPLARPHARAKLECTSCHKETTIAGSDSTSAFVASASKACGGCHGPHPSTRPGHQRVTAAGQMGCPTCHAVHRGDQGVTFAPGAVAIRFAPGVEAEEARVVFSPTEVTTVPIVTAGSCKGCHDVTSSRDPIARCLVPGQEALADRRPIVCFDEHQIALPPDEPRAQVPGGPRGPGRIGDRGPDVGSGRVGGLGTGVCSNQHGTDRALAWEAAREVAAVAPTVGASRGTFGGPWTWLGAGLGAAALAFAGVRGGRAFGAARRASKRRDAAPPPEAMLRPPTRMRLPQINTNTCIGCYACVDACPYDVLEVERYVAVVARPDACCGLTLCEQRCPNGSLVITDGEPIGDRPRISDALESLDTPGLFLAGDVTGLPLIKNAILQGAHAVDQVAASLKARRDSAPRSPDARAGQDAVLDLIVVGAGPAGISAALRAKELGLRCETIEQGSVAQSIQSFPRGKLVFDQPLELPVTGKLWLKESSKEELLAQWLRIVRQERLVIHQDTRMSAIARDPGGGFVVSTEPREGGATTRRAARRVVLAIGQRGSPRRLPFDISEEVEARVHYHLADARSFEGKKVVVVGLGDVAMETTIALGRQPDTGVTVVYRGSDFSRGKTRNIDEVRRMRDAGRIELLFDTAVEGITRDQVSLRTPAGRVTRRYDAVMVMIGSIPPWDTLRAAGIQTAAAGDRIEADAVQGNAPPPAP